MFDSEPLDGPEKEFAQALRSLSPAGAGGAEQLLFEAGRRKERRRLLVWRGIAGTLAACLGVSLLARPAAQTVQTVVYVPRQLPVSQPTLNSGQLAAEFRQGESSRPFAYLQLRQAVLSRGLDALPPSPGAAALPDDGRLERLLGFTPNDPDAAALRKRLDADGGRL